MANDLLLQALLAEQQHNAATNPWLVGGKAFSSTPLQFNTAKNPWAALGAAFTQGLVGSGLQSYGANQVKLENDALTQSLLGTIMDTPSYEAQASALAANPATAKFAPYAKYQGVMQQQELANELAKLNQAASVDMTKKKYDKWLNLNYDPDIAAQTELAKIQAQDQGGFGPKTEAENALRKDIQALKPVQELELMQPGMKAMLDNFNLSSPATDMVYTYGFMQIMEPGGIVRENEVNQVRSTMPIAQKFKNEMEGALNGTGVLSQEAKFALLDAVSKKYDSAYSQVQDKLGGFRSLVDARGLRPENVFSTFNYTPFGELVKKAGVDFTPYVGSNVVGAAKPNTPPTPPPTSPPANIDPATYTEQMNTAQSFDIPDDVYNTNPTAGLEAGVTFLGEMMKSGNKQAAKVLEQKLFDRGYTSAEIALALENVTGIKVPNGR